MTATPRALLLGSITLLSLTCFSGIRAHSESEVKAFSNSVADPENPFVSRIRVAYATRSSPKQIHRTFVSTWEISYDVASMAPGFGIKMARDELRYWKGRGAALDRLIAADIEDRGLVPPVDPCSLGSAYARKSVQ
jgi:hypothetical protein